jgi:hypothetical protein
VRPNPVLAPRHVYQEKTARWRQQWPSLTVLPWAERPAATGSSGTSVERDVDRTRAGPR